MFNKRTFLLLFLLIIAIGTVSSVCASDLSDDAVGDSSFDKMEVVDNDEVIEETNNQDSLQMDEGGSYDDDWNDDESGDDEGSYSSDSFTALNKLIKDAPEGSTITLNSDYYYDYYDDYDFDDVKGVVIDKTLVIEGNGHTIDADEYSRIFTIYSDYVVLNNLTFLNAVNGCIYIYNNYTTTVTNCNFINNTGEFGAAIVTSSTLLVDNCYFFNNHAYNDGGAIYAYYPLNGINSLSVSNSVFDWNWAERYGGAIYLGAYTGKGVYKTSSAKSFIDNVTFIQNEAVTGGALFNYQYVDISDSQFTSNFVSGNGGAIYMSSGALFYDQDHKPLIAYPFGLEIHGNSSFIDNYADGSGGAIRISSTEDHLSEGIKGILHVYDNVSFELNSAQSGGALSLVDSESFIENARFINNVADEGSAMMGGTAYNCIFEGNSGTATYGAEIIDNYKGKLTLKQSGTYYKDKTLTVTLTNADTGAALSDKKVVIKFSNGKSATVTTNSKGVATYKVPFNPGTYTATASVSSKGIEASPAILTGVKIVKAPIKITPTKLSTAYASGKYFQVKVINSKTKKVVSGAKLKLKVYTGKKSKTVTVTTNSKGIAKYSTSKLAVGTHKVIVSNGQTSLFTGAKKTSSIKISKASYKIVAPKVTNIYKKAGKFKITVKNKASGKVVKGVKLTVKVYTGSKYKTYTVKTNSKGVATVSTKALSKGTHKVAISTKATGKYKAAKKSSSAKIVNKIPTSIGYVPGLIFYATNDGYHTHTYRVVIEVVLKDNAGNELTKPVKLIHSDGYTASGYSGNSISVDGGRPGTVTLKFAGDSKYMASSYVVNLGNEPF